MKIVKNSHFSEYHQSGNWEQKCLNLETELSVMEILKKSWNSVHYSHPSLNIYISVNTALPRKDLLWSLLIFVLLLSEAIDSQIKTHL